MMEYPLLYVCVISRARISTLMSFSDGLGQYIFCRKTGKTRPMREEMEEKVFKTEIFDISDNLTPPMWFKVVDEWQTSSDVGTFDSIALKRTFFLSSPSATPPPRRQQK